MFAAPIVHMINPTLKSIHSLVEEECKTLYLDSHNKINGGLIQVVIVIVKC